jgi:hypothetical protein
VARAYDGVAVIINNLSGATFNALSDAAFARQNGGRMPVFKNLAGGNFFKTVGTTTSQTIVDWAFDNAGLAQVKQGALWLNHGGTSVGTFQADSAAFLRFTGGTHNVGTGCSMKGVGKVQIAGATVTGAGTVTGAVTSPGAFELTSGTLNGTFTYAGTGVFNWTGGTVGEGTLNISAGSTLNASGAGIKFLYDNTVLNNSGIITWSGTGPIQGRCYDGTGPIINNKSGAQFKLLGDGAPFSRQNGGRIPVFNNQSGAKFIKSAGTGKSTLHSLWSFINNGEVQTASGILEFVDNYVEFNTGSTLTGAGTLRLATNVHATTTLTSSCRVNLDGGTLTGDTGTGGATLFTYTGSGPFDWTDGTFSGKMILAAGATLNAKDGAAGATTKFLFDNSVIDNKGTITWSGSGPLQARAYDGVAVVINNLSGALFEIKNNGTVFNRQNGGRVPVFNNLAGARFLKSGGTGSTLVTSDWQFNNSGEMSAATGTLEFNTGNALNLNSGGTLTGAGKHQVSGGSLNLSGTTMANTTSFTIAGGDTSGVGAAGGIFKSSNGGIWNWSGGTFYGVLTVDTASHLEINGANNKHFFDNVTFNNKGTINWSGTGGIVARAYDGVAVIINNLSGATFNALSDAAFARQNGGRMPVFINAGLFNLTGKTTTDWAFSQSSTGTLQSNFSSATVYGRMVSSQGVALNGALKVNIVGAYAPALGTAFNLINPPTAASGIFSGLPQGATLMVGTRAFNIVYSGGDGNDVVLTHLPAMSVTGPAAAITEGNSASVNAAFNVRLSVASTQTVTVNYDTVAGTATAGSDFTGTTGTLTFAPGETSKNVNVPVLGDEMDEDSETFKLRLAAPLNATLTTSEASATITDDDAAPSLAVTNPRAFKEGSAAAPGSTTFNVILSAPSSKRITVAYATADGVTNGAKAGIDYVAKSGTLTFEPGQTRKAVSVPFIGESLDELNEPFFLDIKTPTNATIADSRGAAYIGNDDGPSIFVDNARSVTEGSTVGQTTPQDFVVRLSAASPNTVTVDWTTANGPQGTGAGPADFVAATGRLTFAPGETQRTITVQVKQDATVEPNETYRVNLTRPTFAIIADSQGVGYILNDDVAASSVSRNEPSQ